MRNMFEESTLDPIENCADSVSPVCDGAADEVSVCLWCVLSCLVGEITNNFGSLRLPLSGHT